MCSRLLVGQSERPSRTAVLNLFRLADHLTNFVSVRGPPKMSTFSRENFRIADDLYLVILPKFFLVSRTTKKNFANFPNFFAFFRFKDRKNILISFAV